MGWPEFGQRSSFLRAPNRLISACFFQVICSLKFSNLWDHIDPLWRHSKTKLRPIRMDIMSYNVNDAWMDDESIWTLQATKWYFAWIKIIKFKWFFRSDFWVLRVRSVRHFCGFRSCCLLGMFWFHITSWHILIEIPWGLQLGCCIYAFLKDGFRVLSESLKKAQNSHFASLWFQMNLRWISVIAIARKHL